MLSVHMCVSVYDNLTCLLRTRQVIPNCVFIIIVVEDSGALVDRRPLAPEVLGLNPVIQEAVNVE